MPIRSAVFYDGFNMYHALDELGQPYLKWVDLWSLSQKLLSADEELVAVTHCTAVRTDDVPRMLRHRAYLAALEGVNVKCLRGHFSDEMGKCHDCGSQWKKPVEKQGDVNLAIAIIDGGHQDAFDNCYLVTADGDQLATIKLFRERFPDKKIISVSPPGRIHNKASRDSASNSAKITKEMVALSLFGHAAQGRDRLIKRPPEYDPPEQQVIPQDQ